MKQVSLLLVALLISNFVSSQSNYVQTERTDAQKLFDIQKLIFNEQKFDEALVELDKVAKNVPKNYSQIYSEQKRFFDQYEYDEFIEITKNTVPFILDAYSKVYYLYAVIYIERGNWEKAEQYLLTGLKQVPNVHLLCEMGMLYQQKYSTTFDVKDLDLSTRYFADAIDNSSFCSSHMEARALRGIGFNLIELGDLDLAEQIFRESLNYEEHKNALVELEYIKQLRESVGSKPSTRTSNTNSDVDITSYTYLYEQMEKMPTELQEVANENRYAYIFSKAALFLTSGSEKFREGDYFKYPLKSWNEEKLISGCNQIIYYTRGLSPKYCFENMTESEFQNLLEMFHFEVVDVQKTSYENVVKGIFIHKIDKSKIEMYCRISN